MNADLPLTLLAGAARQGWYVYLRPIWLEGAPAPQWSCTLEKPPLVPGGQPIAHRALENTAEEAVFKAAFLAGISIPSRKDSPEMTVLPTAYQEQDWKRWVKLTSPVSLELTEGQLRWLYDMTARASNNLQPGRPYGNLGNDGFRDLVESIGRTLLEALPGASPMTPQSKRTTIKRAPRSTHPVVTSRPRKDSDRTRGDRVDSPPPRRAKMAPGPNEPAIQTPEQGQVSQPQRVRRIIRHPRSTP